MARHRIVGVEREHALEAGRQLAGLVVADVDQQPGQVDQRRPVIGIDGVGAAEVGDRRGEVLQRLGHHRAVVVRLEPIGRQRRGSRVRGQRGGVIAERRVGRADQALRPGVVDERRGAGRPRQRVVRRIGREVQHRDVGAGVGVVAERRRLGGQRDRRGGLAERRPRLGGPAQRQRDAGARRRGRREVRRRVGVPADHELHRREVVERVGAGGVDRQRRPQHQRRGLGLAALRVQRPEVVERLRPAGREGERALVVLDRVVEASGRGQRDRLVVVQLGQRPRHPRDRVGAERELRVDVGHARASRPRHSASRTSPWRAATATGWLRQRGAGAAASRASW